MPPLTDPWERLKKLIAVLAGSFAVSYQIVVIALLAVFVVIVTLLMIIFRIVVPNI